MPTSAQMDDLHHIRDTLGAEAERRILQILPLLEGLTPAAARDALLDLIPALVKDLSDADAAAAAQWFQEAYGLKPRLGPGLDPTHVRSGVRSAAGTLWTDDLTALAELLVPRVTRWARQGGRSTLRASARAHKMRWARVPRGATTCAFCTMLASRGGVYESEDTAGSVNNRFHDDCDCLQIPVRGPEDYPPGYDPDDLYQHVYRPSRDAVGDYLDTEAILADMRRRSPGRITDGVQPEPDA